MAEGEIDNLTMEQYLALTRGDLAPGVVKPEIGGNVNFEIKRVSHDAVMLRVFPITLTGAIKRWVDRIPPGTIDSWDLLKNPLSKGTVHHQKQPSSLKKSATSSRKET
ncbi:hypothetical protein Tco_1535429, partial [Tanacetum coccineum]